MKVVNFPSRGRSRATVSGNLESIRALLSECLGHQASLREEGLRLRNALRRLRVQTGALSLCQSRLNRSLGRLRAVQIRLRRPLPEA